jgi:uric acid-xanthine permease
MNAISLVMETGFAVTAFLALFLNLFLPEEIEDEVVDINGKDGEVVLPAETRGEAKTVGSSSRGSDVESVDKIQQMQAKEISP